MRLTKKKLILILLLGLLLILVIWQWQYIFAILVMLYLLQSGVMDCGNKLQNILPSPDHTKVATVIIRDCGATTDYSTHVFVRNPADKDSDDNAVLILRGMYPVTLHWNDATHLKVVYPLHPDPHYTEHDEPPFTHRTQWQGVHIDYLVKH